MNHFRRFTILCFLFLGLPAGVSAQNPYVSFRGAASWAENTLSGAPGENERYHFGTGYAVGGALGYGFASGLSAEGEFSYLYNPVDSHGGVPLYGAFRNYLYMANLGYTFGRDSSSPVKPFVGFGIGAVRQVEDHPYFDEDADAVVDDLERWNKFAYQFRAGVAVEVADPVDLSVGYRHVRINGNDEHFEDGGGITTEAIPHHMLEFGFNFRF